MDLAMAIKLIGGLGVFLYGIKLMSEALQQVAGSRMRTLLGRMTGNRFAAVLSGLLITTTIQSSSATTVMLVGFVNAGLMSLVQATGVIMGANIGTTVTAWLISLLGFKVSITKFALPAVALGVVCLFTRRDRLVRWGGVLLGFGFLFLGLAFLKEAVPNAAKNPEAFQFLKTFVGERAFTDLNWIDRGFFLDRKSTISSTKVSILPVSSSVLETEALGYMPSISPLAIEFAGSIKLLLSNYDLHSPISLSIKLNFLYQLYNRSSLHIFV